MEGLQKDTLELIQQTVAKAEGAAGKATVLTIPGQPKHRVTIVTSDGKVTTADNEPEPRRHTLVTLDECIQFINSRADADSAVWFDRTGVIVVLDDSTRRDVACMELKLTPQMALLQQIEKDKKRYDQRSFRRLLRIDLAACLKDLVLLNWVSTVKFNLSSTSGGTISQGKESLGKDINDAALSDQGECPEEIGLEVRPFDDHGLKETWGVKCAVEVFLREGEFTITPLPLELHNAIECEVDVIGQKLRAAVKVPCFRGRP